VSPCSIDTTLQDYSAGDTIILKPGLYSIAQEFILSKVLFLQGETSTSPPNVIFDFKWKRTSRIAINAGAAMPRARISGILFVNLTDPTFGAAIDLTYADLQDSIIDSCTGTSGAVATCLQLTESTASGLTVTNVIAAAVPTSILNSSISNALFHGNNVTTIITVRRNAKITNSHFRNNSAWLVDSTLITNVPYTSSSTLQIINTTFTNNVGGCMYPLPTYYASLG